MSRRNGVCGEGTAPHPLSCISVALREYIFAGYLVTLGEVLGELCNLENSNLTAFSSVNAITTPPTISST